MQTTVETAPRNRWATIAEISETLGVKRDTIKQVVQKAHDLQQDWVKLEPYPPPAYPSRWLIDTSHAIYQYHERRWLKLVEQAGAEETPEMLDDVAHSQKEDEAKMIQSCSTRGAQQQAIDVIKTWPELCLWLADRGLVVFVNALAADENWQWCWMGNSSSGYPDAAAAITAALQYQLVHAEPFLPLAYLSLDSVSAPAEPVPPLWKSWFRRK